MKKAVNPFILAFDMDGTLLNSKKEISFKTARYLRKLSKQGHHIVIASGRPPRSIEKYYKQLGLNTPIVCYNGEYIYSPTDKNFETVAYSFSKEIVFEVLEKVGKDIVSTMCEDDKNIWVDKEDKYLDKFFWYKGMDVHCGKINDILNKETMTCIFHCTEEFKTANKIEKITEKWPDIVPIFWIGNPYFELHHKNATKGNGLKTIAQYYGIPADRVIAFGDATNDIEMFEYAKTSVLMKNAKYDLSNKTTMVSIKDNDHNGIYYTLKKLLK